ncbi:hypothetical protein ACI789_23950 [Geodermatophilus sp. SYSU D00965]
MTEAPRTPNPTTAQFPSVPPAGATAAPPSGPVPAGSAPSGPQATGPVPGTPPPPGAATPPPGPPPAPAVPARTPEDAAGPQPTGPVPGPPRVGPRRSSPLTRMGPWAPAAGALVGLLAGVVAVLFLASAADAFDERMALVFLVVGLGMLGASGALLADEVRLVRRGAREAGIRPAWVEATANLVNGLTPARLLLLASAFVLFLAAFVAT